MASTPYVPPPQAADSPNGDRESQSAFGLLRRLTDELATLLRQELALATPTGQATPVPPMPQ